MEKPLAISVADAERVQRAATESDRLCMVDLKYRFAHAVEAARQFVPRPIALFGQAVGDPEPPGHWWLDPRYTTGVVYDLGPHLFDLLYWLAGEAEPVRVYAEGGALQRPGASLVDTLLTTVQFANGVRATAVIGNLGTSAFASKWFLESFGGDRSATVYDHTQSVALRHANGEIVPAALPPDRSPKGDLKWALAHFLDAVITGGTPAITAADGVRVTRMIEAALESAASGRPSRIL